MDKALKQEIIAKYGRSEGDTGSPEVQIALLTARINAAKNGNRLCYVNLKIKSGVRSNADVVNFHRLSPQSIEIG